MAAPGSREGGTDESAATVAVALAANIVIAVAKLAGGLITGSGALLSEAAHSVADSMNEVFLVVSLRSSGRAPDAEHPFGYGKERYFWSMLAAVGIFVTGACFSAYEGVSTLRSGRSDTKLFWVVYLVLLVSLLADGSSWLKAVRQLLGSSRANSRGVQQELRTTRDTTLTTVLAEDTAGVLGVLIAALGVALHQITGSVAYEGAASLAIAGLLTVAAFSLGRQNKALLIGQSAEPGLRLLVWDQLSAADAVSEVLEVLTMQLAPDLVLIAARVDLADGLDSGAVEDALVALKLDLAGRIDMGAQIFLDVTDVDFRPERVGQARDLHAGLRARSART